VRIAAKRTLDTFPFCSPASPARGGGSRGQSPLTETEREIQKSFTVSGLTKWIVISTDYLVICRDYYLDLKGEF
jgi:hypothetical protein